MRPKERQEKLALLEATTQLKLYELLELALQGP